MARELLDRWQESKMIKYVSLSKENTSFDGNPFSVTSEKGHRYKVSHPTYKDAITQLAKLKSKLVELNDQALIKRIMPLESYASVLSEIHMLESYIELYTKGKHDRQTESYKDAFTKYKRANDNLRKVIEKKDGAPGQYASVVKEVIMGLGDAVSARKPQLIERTVLYIDNMPVIEKILSRQEDKTVPNTTKTVERIKRIKERVLPAMSPFKVISKRFTKEDECKTTKRSKEYYVTKADLVKMIREKPSLRVKFTGLDKMSKDEICERLFDEAENIA